MRLHHTTYSGQTLRGGARRIAAGAQRRRAFGAGGKPRAHSGCSGWGRGRRANCRRVGGDASSDLVHTFGLSGERIGLCVARCAPAGRAARLRHRGLLTTEYRDRVHALCDLYAQPHDPQQPVVCLDEKSKQLLQSSRMGLPERPNHATPELLAAELHAWQQQRNTAKACLHRSFTRQDADRKLGRQVCHVIYVCMH